MRFGGTLKEVEKYWETGPDSVCMGYAGIGHDPLGECRERVVKCVIYIVAHKVKNYKCGMPGYTVKMGRICTYVMHKCANCEGNHQVIAFKYPAQLRAQAEVWKEKAKKPQLKDKRPAVPPALEKELEVRSTKIEVDIVPTL